MHSDCDTVKKGSHKHPSQEFTKAFKVWVGCSCIKMTAFIGAWNKKMDLSGAPNENIVQNHLNIALLNVF